MPTRRIITVVDDHGNAKALAGKVADGGEGSIHAIAGRDDVLAKIYHPTILADAPRRIRLEYKIRAMAQHPELRTHPHLARPLLPLQAPGFGWCGYAMWRKPGVSLRALLGSPLQLARHCPHWHRQHLVRQCLDFLDTLAFLAANRALPVDFNPGNLLVDIANVRVHFIDCGSFQFQSDGRLFQGESITPDMAAPETLRQGGAGLRTVPPLLPRWPRQTRAAPRHFRMADGAAQIQPLPGHRSCRSRAGSRRGQGSRPLLKPPTSTPPQPEPQCLLPPHPT